MYIGARFLVGMCLTFAYDAAPSFVTQGSHHFYRVQLAPVCQEHPRGPSTRSRSATSSPDGSS
ncbi:hypothetical protein FIBSPDRAFT_848940 [Athelia psychrophila]|uniref:Secreted protein n=1 Tax=Athelia psychrophila TaxID=1759441 RepID=A0A166URV2_9AGAM|nr:hypothetical protein FIBSPDRAFT_848940 [Fibularhizoctonia sp. CBS 109695]